MNINVGNLNEQIEKAITELKNYLNNINFLDSADIDYIDILFKYLDKNKYNYSNIGSTYIIHIENDSYIVQYAS